jgi:hypothetical protein
VTEPQTPGVEKKSWRFVLPEDRWNELREDPTFHAILKLCRIANTLRFVQTAPFGIEASDSPAASRQRLSSFLYNAALVSEALKTTQTLGKYFRNMPEFINGLGALHRDSETERIKTELLDRARNQAVYHIEDALPKESLAKISLAPPYIFAAASGERTVDVHYPLADWVFLNYILGTPEDGDTFKERYASAFKDLMQLSQKLDDAADALIAAYARTVGAIYEEYDHAA